MTHSNSPKRAVGVDLGKRRIGLAVSDDRGVIALPYRVIAAASDLQASAEAVAAEVFERRPTHFIVGLPRALSGGEGAFTATARAFIEKLRLVAPKARVVPWDERLTSAGADRQLRALGVRRKERAAKSDSMAACAILQSYLDAEAAASPER